MEVDGEIFARVEAFISWMNDRRGQWFEISEMICSSEENYDRHFTTMVKMKLQLDCASCRFSGARIMCLGLDGGLYEIAADQLCRVNGRDDGFIFIEKLTGSWRRRSEIVLWKETC